MIVIWSKHTRWLSTLIFFFFLQRATMTMFSNSWRPLKAEGSCGMQRWMMAWSWDQCWVEEEGEGAVATIRTRTPQANTPPCPAADPSYQMWLWTAGVYLSDVFRIHAPEMSPAVSPPKFRNSVLKTEYHTFKSRQGENRKSHICTALRLCRAFI